ncbi:MAG: hypothetical protein ACK5QS_07780 [Pseudanabaenaceae cyanobacterium]
MKSQTEPAAKNKPQSPQPSGDHPSCKRCGSENLSPDSWAKSRTGKFKTRRYKCDDCGKRFSYAPYTVPI